MTAAATTMAGRRKVLPLLGVIAACLPAAGCVQGAAGLTDEILTASIASASRPYSTKDRDCLARAMFFESNRSSREGMLAVGTVVMNRVSSEKYPGTVCGVVGQKGQFAPGVLSRPMNSKGFAEAERAAADVLGGERHSAVREAMFFHQAGLKFPYNNMHYVLEAGGNAFYEKRSRRRAK